MADYCYSKLSKEDDIFVEGNLNSNLEIVAKEIILIAKKVKKVE